MNYEVWLFLLFRVQYFSSTEDFSNYCSIFRRLRAYESHMSTVALSNVESARTVSQILYEMANASDFWVKIMLRAAKSIRECSDHRNLYQLTVTLNYFYMASIITHMICRNECNKVSMWWQFNWTKAAVIIVILSVIYTTRIMHPSFILMAAPLFKLSLI